MRESLVVQLVCPDVLILKILVMELTIAKMVLMKEIAVRLKYYLDDRLEIEEGPTLRGKVRFKYLVQIQGFLDKKTR